MKKGVRLFTISLISACLFMGCATASGSFSAVAGHWAGTVNQADKTYPVEMILDGNAKIGSTVGSIEYPSFSCLGALIGRKAEGVNYTVTEQITRGKSKCVDEGIIKLVYNTSPPSLDWKWYYPSGKLGATATLTPISQSSQVQLANTGGQSLDKGIEILAQQLVASLPPEKKPLLAILDFSNLEGNVTAFGRLVGEELVTKLFMTRKVRVVERSLLEKAVTELKFNLSELVDPDRAKRLGRQVGADTIITGTITDLKTSVKINARMIAVETGDILAAAGVEVIQDQVITGLLAQVLKTPAPPQQPTSPPLAQQEEKPKEIATPPQTLPVLETESYRVTIESVKKSGNSLTMVMIFENLTSKMLVVGMDLCGNATHLLDDVGEKWKVRSDTAGIFSGCGGRVELAPKTKRRTTVSIETDESGAGTVFTLVLEESIPKSRKHVMHNIRVDQK